MHILLSWAALGNRAKPSVLKVCVWGRRYILSCLGPTSLSCSVTNLCQFITCLDVQNLVVANDSQTCIFSQCFFLICRFLYPIMWSLYLVDIVPSMFLRQLKLGAKKSILFIRICPYSSAPLSVNVTSSFLSQSLQFGYQIWLLPWLQFSYWTQLQSTLISQLHCRPVLAGYCHSWHPFL